MPEMTAAIRRMRGWLGSVIAPDGEVPLLNDGYPVGARCWPRCGPAACGPGPLLTLPDTGLVRATAGGWHLLADVGAPCPDELPAHAHADTFSCLVHVDGCRCSWTPARRPTRPGPTRSYERSTAAHNTVEVDGADSTEVWGAFRAARRARVRGVAARSEPDGVTIEAAHDGFRRLRGQPVHRRRWSLIG